MSRCLSGGLGWGGKSMMDEEDREVLERVERGEIPQPEWDQRMR
ncbi:MAG: hypothetical protein ABGZ49_08050 [Akkermansiaceae bacterium]